MDALNWISPICSLYRTGSNASNISGPADERTDIFSPFLISDFFPAYICLLSVDIGFFSYRYRDLFSSNIGLLPLYIALSFFLYRASFFELSDLLLCDIRPWFSLYRVLRLLYPYPIILIMAAITDGIRSEIPCWTYDR